MTKSELDQIRARADAATLGPWCYTQKDCKYFMNSLFIDREGDPNGVGLVTSDINQDNADLYATDDDMELIAHARTDVPALCDALEAAMEALEDLYYAADRRDRTQGARELVDQWRAD